MRPLIVSFLCCLSVYIMAQQPNPNSSLISTEVLPGNQVAFRIYAPEARSVNLQSDDKWDKVEFKKDSLGIWEGIWSDVEPGAYRYRFVVDGVNVYDPKAPTA
jgi:enterochelin esterase family protein